MVDDDMQEKTNGSRTPSDFDRFDEFEDYRDSIRDAELEFWVKGLKESAWSIRHFDFGDVHVQFGIEGGGEIAEGTVRSDGWVFFFQAGGGRTRSKGVTMPPDSALLIAPGDRFVITSDEPHCWYSVFVPNALLFEDAKAIKESLGYGDTSRVVTLPDEYVGKIRQFGKDVSGARFESSADLQEDVIAVGRRLLQLPGRHAKRVGRRPENRTKLLTKVVTYIEQYPQMNPSAKELIAASGVSDRTLRNAFSEYFGLGPRDFVMLRRIHECRKLLRESHRAHTTVKEVAAQFGFTDFGRFAGYYKRIFLELPSETVERVARD